MKRKPRQKVEDKPMDFLNTFNNERIEENKEEEKNKSLYEVKVTHPSLRIRRAPNTQAEIIGLITDQGIYKIFDEVNGWGQLEDGNWIMLSYTEII